MNNVIGTSALLDLGNTVPVDYMHCVLEGVTKWLMHALVDSKNNRASYYLTPRTVKVIDVALQQQCPPHAFTWPPRSISKHLCYWNFNARNASAFQFLSCFLRGFVELEATHYTQAATRGRRPALLSCGKIHVCITNP